MERTDSCCFSSLIVRRYVSDWACLCFQSLNWIGKMYDRLKGRVLKVKMLLLQRR